ncbi:MAG: acyl-CoA dehydrogenase, partial [Proteobacteria bacterium]|nr:acyl-CoA dehydrogenase [Pseudomonadota bacterium]
GHCELEFDGLEIADDNILGQVGDGLKVTQVRLGPARLTHCMRWLGLSKRCMDIAAAYAAERTGFGIRLADRESIQLKMGELAHDIQVGRLLVMHAAWKLDQGDFARKEVSMAKVHVADTLHKAADVAIQINGARGYSKDTILDAYHSMLNPIRKIEFMATTREHEEMLEFLEKHLQYFVPGLDRAPIGALRFLKSPQWPT